MIEELPQPATFPLSFLHELALDRQRVLSESEQSICDRVRQALQQADAVVVHIGGKAGRLGECVVATGLLEGILHALRYAGKAGMPITIFVDEVAGPLFDAGSYQKAYWSHITIYPVSHVQNANEMAMLVQQVQGPHLLVFDLHGEHDGMPSLQVEDRASDEEGQARQVTTLAHLFRVGVRSYAQRGSQRRYADCIEDLFGLPGGAIEGVQAQPCIRLSEEDEARYPALLQQYRLDVPEYGRGNGSALPGCGGRAPHTQARQSHCPSHTRTCRIICFFQSVVIAKCYWRWDEVLMQLCQYLAQHFPAQKVEFLIACGPDELHPEGLRQADFLEEFGDFSGVNQNAQVRVIATRSLRDLALLTQHAVLALSDDTGPGHIAGALQVPTITPYLPGNIYSRTVWASTLWHRGVTLDPSPFSYQQIEAAVLWERTNIIDSIPPEQLLEEVVKSLVPRLQRSSI